MNNTYKIARQTLYAIYNKHRRKYRGNSDTEQMCCMWSTNNPPDIILDMQPICDIENAFNVEIDENMAMEIYDMTLDKAIKKIMEINIIQDNL